MHRARPNEGKAAAASVKNKGKHGYRTRTMPMIRVEIEALCEGKKPLPTASVTHMKIK